MEIEKNLAIFIEQQFPGIYKEDGPELVALVEEYYKFLDTQENQSTYVSRRMFEYRDIDTTLSSMIIFFKKKFLDNLPLKESSIRVVVKNILDLYRRKGTPAGIELFFALFFQEYDIDIVYPAEKMLKVSNSQWRQGIYLQLFPNDNTFLSKTEKQYTYKDLISKNIVGSASEAKAAVSKVNFIKLNGIKTPIVYIDAVQGNFQRYDEIVSYINGEAVSFGRVNGSLSAIEIDETSGNATTGNSVGDILNVVSQYGDGGKAIVTDVSTAVSGQVEYNIDDGGYGYSIDNTRLQVSNQALLLRNDNQDFIPFERLRDSAGNEGIVIGQNETTLGVKMNAIPATDPIQYQSFDISRPISTLDRDTNITLTEYNPITDTGEIFEIAQVNATSPGLLYPDTGDANTSVIVSELTDTTSIDVITDLLAPFLDDFDGQNKVRIDAADYNAVGDVPMSGTASPVNLNTPLDEAFDIQNITIGSIKSFTNLLRGNNYENQVFARAEDDVIKNLDRKNQIIKLTVPSNAGSFSVGEIVTEQSTGIAGRVARVDTLNGFISVIPYDYFGFNGSNNILRANQDVIQVSGVEVDYDSRALGDNAVIVPEVEYATGKIREVGINNSGYGYVEGIEAQLTDEDGIPQAEGTIIANTQGKTEGYWADYSSHLNGYIQKPISSESPIIPTQALASEALKIAVGSSTSPTQLEAWATSLASDGFAYLDMNKTGSIASNDAFELLKIYAGIASAEVTERWETIVAPSLKEQAWFSSNSQLYQYVPVVEYYSSGQVVQDSDFYQEYSYQIKSTIAKNQYEDLLKENVHLAGTKMFGDFIYKTYQRGTTKARFVRLFNDQGKGSPLDKANVDTLRASVTNFTTDSIEVTADHEPTL